MITAWDVDGTLISMRDAPRYEVIDLLRWFLRNGDRVIIWSGGGKEYAEHWARRLFGDDAIDRGNIMVSEKTQEAARMLAVDLAVDDEFVDLGRCNLKV